MREELLRRAREDKDRKALADLIELDQKEIYQFMKRRLGHLQDAEDATQETFRQMLLSIRSLRDAARYRGWLYRIALRVAQAARTRRALERREIQATAAALTRRTDSMDNRSELQTRIHAAVDLLDDDLRTVILLRYEQGLRYEEIAHAIARPEGTVAKRLHTAHERLTKALATSGFILAAGALSEALGSARPPAAIPLQLSDRLKDLALRSRIKASVGVAPALAVALLAIVVTVVPMAIRTGAGSARAPSSGNRSLHTRSPFDSAAPSSSEVPPANRSGDSVRIGEPGPELLARVRGCVRDRTTGAPIPGASVWLERSSREEIEDHPLRMSEVSTGPDGSFVLDAPSGSYLIDALATGYVRFRAERIMESHCGDLPSSLEGSSFTHETGVQIRAGFKLDLLAGRDMNPTIQLLPASEIRVQIVDRAGRPLPEAEVTLGSMTLARTVQIGDSISDSIFETTFEPDGRTSRYQTDLSGRVSITNLYPQGTALLSVSKKGFQTQKQSLRMDRPIVQATLVLIPGLSLAGRVQSERGEPVRGACIVFLDASRHLRGDFRDRIGQRPPLSPETRSPDQSEPLVAGADGEFQATDQSSNLTMLAAIAPGFAPRLIALSGADLANIQIVLPQAASLVTGTVTDQGGMVLEGVSVAVHRYEVSHGNSRAELVFRDDRGSAWVDSGTASIATFLPQSFRPPEGTSLENGSFRLEGVAIARGAVAHLEFRKEGYESSTIEVPASGTLSVRLRAKKGGN